MKNVKKIAALGLSATMAMGMLPATLVSADEATGTNGVKLRKRH